MARSQITFDAEDRAVVRGWMTDAALGASLLAITDGWRGVKTSLQQLDVTTPTVPPAEPAAGAYWLLGYSQEPKPALGGNLLSGLPAVLDIWVVHQPQVTGSDPEALVDALVAAIRTHIATKAAAANVPYKVGIPRVRTADVGLWPRWRTMTRLWT